MIVKEHAIQCPLHEDNLIEHDCKNPYALIEWNNRWYLAVVRSPSFIQIPINYCPFCGDELDIISCKCGEIRKALQERELELKGYEKL